MTPSSNSNTSAPSTKLLKRQIMTERELFEKIVSLIRGEENVTTEANDDDDNTGNVAVAEDILSNEDKLRFYGLYKRVTVGRLRCDYYDDDDDKECEGADEKHDGGFGKGSRSRRPDPPSRFNIVAWYKYNAWLECDELSKLQARMEYVKLASKDEYCCHPVGRECRRLYEIYCKCKEEEGEEKEEGEKKLGGSAVKGVCDEEEHKKRSMNDVQDGVIIDTCVTESKKLLNENSTVGDENIAATRSTKLETSDITPKYSSKEKKDNTNDVPTVNVPPREVSTTEKYFNQYLNVQPLLPRGQLDISYADLFFAWNKCFVNFVPSIVPFSSMSPIGQLNHHEKEIANIWCSNFSVSLSNNNKPLKDTSSSSSECDETEMKGESIIKEEVVVGLSVRSLLDLYLTAKSFPSQSEIIMVPAINIQTMVDVMLYHGLRVVPIDIVPKKNGTNEEDVAFDMVDVKAVEKAVTKRTVAIMVVHPFGRTSASEDDMELLNKISRKNGLVLIEDCAECYAGDGDMHGSVHADIKLFSFGTIKTSTALGGGLAILPIKKRTSDVARDNTLDIVERMRRIQCGNLYGQQSNVDYMKKVLKNIFIRWISDYPLIYGLVYAIIEYFGWKYDDIVTSAIRGFSSHRSSDDSRPPAKRIAGQSKDEEMRRRCLMNQIRKRPSVALLSILHRRLLHFKCTAKKVRERIRRCKYVTKMITKYAPAVTVPRGLSTKQERDAYWLFPISVSDPQNVSKRLLAKGYDIPTGTSQLGCVTSFLENTSEHGKENECCPHTKSLMDTLLYLPVSSRDMIKDEILRLVDALHTATTESTIVRLSKEKTIENRGHSRSPFLLSPMSLFPVIVTLMLDSFTLQIIPYSLIFMHMSHNFLVLILPFIAVTLITLLIIAHFLRTRIGLLYLDSSKTFAKYNSMLLNDDVTDSSMHYRETTKKLKYDNKQSEESKKNSSIEMVHEQSSSLFDMDALKLPVLRCDNAEEPAVLLTGATGFIGSLLLRYLLLYRKDFSIGGGVVIICRSKRGRSASERINQLLSTKMFSFLSDEEKRSSLITVIEGDVIYPNVGLSIRNMEKVCKEMNITHVFHCAAAVSFTQSLDDAAMSNITSSLQLQSLTRQLKNKDAKFIHVSTAFVHGNSTGTEMSPLPEDLFPLYPYDPEELYRSMIETQSYASSAMHKLGFPNTYTFSKCVCEHLLLRNDSVNTIIIRPSIVGPAVSEPHEGWAGESPSTVVAAACLYLMYQYNLWCFGKERVPCIPVDVVCRYILSKAFMIAPSNRAMKDLGQSVLTNGFSSSKTFNAIKDEAADSKNLIENCLGANNNDSTIMATLGGNRIYTVAWDASSPPATAFLWLDYAFAVTQLGAVKGYFTRPVVYIGLLVTVHIFPYFKITHDAFKMLHRIVVLLPLNALQSLCNFVKWQPKFLPKLEKLIPFLDLPLLFYPYVNVTFHFKSELKAPSDFNGERYMFSCAVAAERFVDRISNEQRRKRQSARQGTNFTKADHNNQVGVNSAKLSHTIVAGKNHVPLTTDVWWALTQPRGNYTIRLIGWFLLKLFSRMMTEVTVDMASFVLNARKKDDKPSGQKSHVILVPTHRSFFDFLLISFVCFALPEMDLDIPYIAAADEFARVPILGSVAKLAQAFFLKRGNGKADPDLSAKLIELKQNNRKPVTIEVFIEGKRSRDRRFIKPKTGFLRCLADTGGDHILLPICISYERIPEQSTLTSEADGASRDCLRLSPGLLLWLKSAYFGKNSVGRVHIAASDPVPMTSSSQTDYVQLGQLIQKRQQEKLLVSSFHINAGAKVLGLHAGTIKRALESLGCNFWPEKESDSITLPQALSELWTIMLQYGHFFAPFFVESHPQWCEWLNPSAFKITVLPRKPINKDVSIVVLTLSRQFMAAEKLVEETIKSLKLKGFSSPQNRHVIQYLSQMHSSTPLLLVKSALCMKLGECNLRAVSSNTSSTKSAQDCLAFQNHFKSITNAGPVQALFRHSTKELATEHIREFDSKDTESFGAWGYADSGFVVKVNRDGVKCVKMKGNRYSISGKSLPHVVSFLEEITKVEIDPAKLSFPLIANVPLPPKSDLSASDLEKLSDIVRNNKHRISTSAIDRARHGTGHSQADMFMIRSGCLNEIRLPDAVIWPEDESEVEALVSLSVINGWCLIPFGGGTNVSHSTRCPPKDIEPRPIISVDIKLMNRILWVNEEDGVAHVQAGITGKLLAHEMELRGYTIGHEPDSIEFSTLGGWIATKASGMKRNKYGNIEDIVKDVRVAGPRGMIWQTRGSEKSIHGRVSTGVDLLSVMLGSEGGLGIITSATIKIWPIPECKEYESIILPCFEDGLRFVRDVAKMNSLKPASIRLLDNEQFRLGKTMSTASTGLRWFQHAITAFIGSMRNAMSMYSAVCTTLSFEGSYSEVRFQKQIIRDIAARHGGIFSGSRIGKAGYELTFAIAYLRDFAMTYNFLAESFETFVPWSKLEHLVKATKERIRQEHKNRSLPGFPFVSCRVTQLYDEGACVYFYFCMNFENVSNPSSVFAEIEAAARKEILANGGSLSHHHGVGKLRAPFMDDVNSQSFKDVLLAIKKSFDEKNTFGARNGAFASCS